MLKTELQGEGDYTCKKPNCAYCQSLKEQFIIPEHLVIITWFGDEIIYTPWSNEEIQLLADNMTVPVKQIMPLFKRRTLKSVYSMRYRILKTLKKLAELN